MTNSFSCVTGLQDAGASGWECNSTLTGLTTGDNKFYFRCKDQPWLENGINASQRNENSGYEYHLVVTRDPLTISGVNPNGTLKYGSEPVNIELEVQTSGGVENGKATCYYSWAGRYIQFLETFSSVHKQPGLNLFGGNFEIPVKCIDDSGNDAYSQINFNIDIDSRAPLVVRAYNSGGVYILTDESSECAYSNNNCNFVFSNGTQMTGGVSREHTAPWESGKTYYIKCRDVFKNEPYSCSIKLKPYNEGE